MSLDLIVYKVDFKNVDGKQHIKLDEINTYRNEVADYFLDKVGDLAEIRNGYFKEVDVVELIQAQRNIKDDIALYEKYVNDIDLKTINEVIEKKGKELAELTGYNDLANNSISMKDAHDLVRNNKTISNIDKHVYISNVSLKSMYTTYTNGIAKSYKLLQMIDEIIKGMKLNEEDIKNYNELSDCELAESYGENTCMVAVWF